MYTKLNKERAQNKTPFILLRFKGLFFCEKMNIIWKNIKEVRIVIRIANF